MAYDNQKPSWEDLAREKWQRSDTAISELGAKTDPLTFGCLQRIARALEDLSRLTRALAEPQIVARDLRRKKAEARAKAEQERLVAEHEKRLAEREIEIDRDLMEIMRPHVDTTGSVRGVPVSALCLRFSAQAALRGAGCHTIGYIVDIGRDGLLMIPRVGSATVSRIERCMRLLGIEWTKPGAPKTDPVA